MSIRSTAVADVLDAEHVGDEVLLDGFDALDAASSRELAFYVGDDPETLAATDAGAVVCDADLSDGGSLSTSDGPTRLRSTTPKADFCKAVTECFGTTATDAGVHPTATVEDGADLGENCTVGPQSYVAECVSLGDGCTIRAGAVLGTQGYNFTPDGDGRLHHLPHEGGVVLGDDVRVGANAVVDRGVFEDTVVGHGTKLDSNVKVGHNVAVGENVRIATGAELSGSVVVGDGAYVHPQVAVASHVTVGDGAEVGIGATVVEDVEAETTVVDPSRPRRIG